LDLLSSETIAAVSTPPGEGGIAIIRISGPGARSIAAVIFKPAGGLPALEPMRLRYGFVVDPESGRKIDEVLFSFMKAPHSYTREDVIELNLHGGPLPVRRTMELILSLGARMARPGEFTLRAFLHGRIDLAQAEAVLDIIRARTDRSLEVAFQQLEGKLSTGVREVRREVMDILARVEACIDFPEEEVVLLSTRELELELGRLVSRVEGFLGDAERGRIYRDGFRVVIAGRVNAGKSSLFNTLLREGRVIVTEFPGTTRDSIEEWVQLGGVPLVLVDTAGLRKTEDPVENMGISRSREALARADMAVLVVDTSAPVGEEDRLLFSELEGRRVFIVFNKIDLSPGMMPDEVTGIFPGAPAARISLLTGEGVDEMESMLSEAAALGLGSSTECPLVSNIRHRDALSRSIKSLIKASETLGGGLPVEFAALDLRAAIENLGEVTGESVAEDLLEIIFSRFCIGK
jgi:tRNA modification GTPase